ncbi:MAG TPA: Omp28-related outer membrane protein [Saprospiraceae bacterium]|nr:Omp28-related outer membrane protein [Saprospiraceae bacterium]
MSNRNISAVYLPFLKCSVLSLCLVLTGCFEEQKVIEPFVPSGNRVVLLEEFTGKGCTNCPKGSRELENLLIQFPNNLVAVSLHAGFFANPQFFPLGTYDLRTDEGEFLIDYLSQPIGYPSGVVNRVPVNGDMQLGLNQWASAISSAIQVPPAIELSIVRTFDPLTRQVVVTVNGIGKEVLEGEIRLSIMLTESGIIDAQDDLEAGGIVPDYVHKHVLRDMLTPSTGANILNGISVGQTFSQTYTKTLEDIWVADDMEIIAFVSLVNGSDFPVLQAASVHLVE